MIAWQQPVVQISTKQRLWNVVKILINKSIGSLSPTPKKIVRHEFLLNYSELIGPVNVRKAARYTEKGLVVWLDGSNKKPEHTIYN